MLSHWSTALASSRTRTPLRALGRVSARFALAAASIGLVLGGAEAIARFAWTDREVQQSRASVGERKPDPNLPKLTRGELSKANIRGVFKGTLYRTNRIGLRGPDYGPRPRPGVYRIAIAGDSVTVGSGVLEEDAYPSVVDGLLYRERREPRIEVINAGLGGINAEWVMTRLERVARFYRFHLAVYGWSVNDIEGTGFRPVQSQPPGWIGSPQRLEHSSSYLLRSLWPRVAWVLERVSPSRGMRAEYRSNYLEDSAAWQTFVSQLDRFARFTSERGICGHVFLHTRLSALGDRHPFKDIYQQVAEAARARGLSVTESLPYHEGLPATRLWVGLYDSHPNIEGHRILAKALQEGLRRDVPRECWDVDLSGWPKLSPIPKKPRAGARHTRDQST